MEYHQGLRTGTAALGFPSFGLFGRFFIYLL